MSRKLEQRNPNKPPRPVRSAHFTYELREKEVVPVVAVELPLDVDEPREPAWMLRGKLHASDGEPELEGVEVVPRGLDELGMPEHRMHSATQLEESRLRILEAFRLLARQLVRSGQGEVLERHGFDLDRATAPVAAQERDLCEHAELIRAVVRRSEKGAVSPAHDAADELALDGKRDYPYPTVRGIMRNAVEAGQVETYAPGRWRFTPAGRRELLDEAPGLDRAA